jgi:spermidine synthase
MVPTYPSGSIGFQFCSEKDYFYEKNNIDKIDGLKYYNSSVHFGSFLTPNFISNL